MKPHLPKVLLSAVLTACCAFSAQAVDIPDTYEQIDIWDSGYLKDYTINTATDSYAFLLGLDTEVPWNIHINGGNLLFTTYDGLPPVSLEFTGSGSSALSNQSSLVFDTLSGLSFTNYRDRAIDASGNLVIQNVTDGVENSENPDVSFTGNSASSPSYYDDGSSFSSGNWNYYYYYRYYGGAIYASNGGVSITGNGDVLFTGNSVSSSNLSSRVSEYESSPVARQRDEMPSAYGYDYSSSSYGGAIYASNGGVSITGNGSVLFTGNTASSSSSYDSTNYYYYYDANDASWGGAIYAAGGDVSITGNGDVSFAGNTASSNSTTTSSSYDSYYPTSSSTASSYGGAIYASNGGVSITGNGDVSFAGNTASSYASSSYSTTTSSSYGGAIYAEGGVSITGNGDVSFAGNTATASSSSSSSYGGAIYAEGGVSITGNGDVLFTGNSATSYSSRGGAIYAGGGVSIIGNETVCFEKNYERVNSTYRLRSIYVAGGGLNLSAKTGGHITFHDSVYGGTTALNADYTDADGKTQQAKGTIIFSGQYTKDHLDAILEENNEGRVATDAEILNSRTSTLGATTLYGGTLQVVDGAVLSTTSLSAVAGSNANVLLRDAGLNGAISFGAGTSLELQGTNTTTGSLTLGDAVSLTVTLDNSHLETAALTLTGSVSTGTLSLNLNVDEDRAAGMYRIFSAGSLATEAAWTAEKVSVQGSGAAAGVTFGDLMWQDGTLYYAASPVWSNHSGSGIWSSTDTNWNNGSAFRAGQDVIFMDRGAGEVQLVGELAPASIHVNNTAGNDYAFTGSGKLGGNTTLTKTGAGELTIATANDYTGATALLEGTLNVHHSTALGATATGAASLTTAAGTTLKVGNTSHLVLAGSSNSLAGAVEVAAGSTLEMKGVGYAASSSTVNGTLAFTGTTASTEELSGSGTVQATDSQVTVGKISGFTGNLQVEGKGSGLSINSGSYTGSGTLSVAGGTLTFGATANITLNAGGQLVLQSWDDAVAGVAANNITVRTGATLAAKASIAALGDMPEIDGYELSVDLNCARLTLNAGATLEVDGACFDLNNGLLTLAVTAASTEKIELVLAENAVYTGSEQIGLFVNVGQGIFAYNGINSSTGTETLYALNAADYFTGAGINEATQLVYDQGSGTVYLQGVVTIPEPATATLSLLALAGLCARRRRK